MKVKKGDILKFSWISDDLFIVTSEWGGKNGHCFVASASRPLSTGGISIYANKSTKIVGHNEKLADIIKKSSRAPDRIERTRRPGWTKDEDDKLQRHTSWPYRGVGLADRNPFLRGIPF